MVMRGEAGNQEAGPPELLGSALRCQVCEAEVPVSQVLIEYPDDYAEEALGTKEKFWFGGSDGRQWLFKFAEYKGRTSGSDWAELVAHAVALDFGIQSACVALASCNGRRGVVVRSVLPPGADLAHGNELMAERDPEYDRELKRRNPRYTVEGMADALRRVGPSDGSASAFSQLAGYLVFDALVAGRDRHHENWAVVAHGQDSFLAPSFDHGNALAFAEPEDRAAELATDSVRLDVWLGKGKSHHIPGRPTLVDVAVDALAQCPAEDRRSLTDRLESMGMSTLHATLGRMPDAEMSEAHRRLAVKIVQTNRRRMLDAVTSRFGRP